MAIEVTPLGFQKPDGNELVKQGDNVIAANAQKAQDLHAKARADIVNLQAAAGFDGDPLVMQDAVVSALVGDEETLTGAALNAAIDLDVSPRFATVTQLPASNGVDDTGVINAALVSSGFVRGIPGETYRLTGKLIMQGNTTLEMDRVELVSGAPSAIIEAAGSLPGRLSPTALLTADAAQGDLTVSLSAAGGLIPGDVLLLGDDDLVVEPPGKPPRYVGEFVTVSSVSGSTATLAGPIRGTYSVAKNAGVERVSMLDGVVIRIGEIRGLRDAKSSGVRLHACRGARVEVGVKDGGRCGIELSQCLDTTLYAPKVSDLRDDIPNGFLGYGINLIGATEGTEILGGSFTRVRHGVTTDGANNERGVPRRNRVVGASATQTTATAFDTHAAGEDTSFTGCWADSVHSGFQIRGTRTVIDGGGVSHASSHGILVSESGGHGSSAVGVQIRHCGGSGVWINGGHNRLRLRGLDIEAVDRHGIEFNAPAQQFEVEGNVIRDVAFSGGTMDAIAFKEGEQFTGGTVCDNRGVQTNRSAGAMGAVVHQASNTTTTTISENRGRGAANVVSGSSFAYVYDNITEDSPVSESSGVVAHIGRQRMVLAASAEVSAAFSLVPKVQNDPAVHYELLITARGSGTEYAARIILAVVRGDGNAATSQREMTNFIPNSIGGAEAAMQYARTVSPSGATMTVTITNNEATSKIIEVILRQY